MSSEVVILSAARSAGGKFGGSLSSLNPTEYGGQVIRETIRRSGIEVERIDQTIFASAWQAGVGPNPARLAAVGGGVPLDSPAVSVNVRCGSSIQALIFGTQAIKAGDAKTVMIGGTESTSQVPYDLFNRFMKGLVPSSHHTLCNFNEFFTNKIKLFIFNYFEVI